MSLALSRHKMVAVFKQEIKLDHPSYMFEFRKSRNVKVSKEGLYIFGGKSNSGTAENQVRVVRIGQKPIIVEEVQTKGKLPVARESHLMQYYIELNSLIIYGGKNDDLQERVLDDIWLLNVGNLNWTQVSYFGL